MATLPRRYSPPHGATVEERVAALELYIRYLEEQIEFNISNQNKKIRECASRIEEVEKNDQRGF